MRIGCHHGQREWEARGWTGLVLERSIKTYAPRILISPRGYSLREPVSPFPIFSPLRILLCAFPLTPSFFFFSVYRFTSNNECTEASHLEDYSQLFPVF